MLTCALTRLSDETWPHADVLFVSDGCWPAPRAALAELAKAREKGTRFHGVQIGQQGSSGLHSVCELVHVFADWMSLQAKVPHHLAVS